MTLNDLRKFVASIPKDVPGDTPIVTLGHYGEIDVELAGMRVSRERREYNQPETTLVIVLDGVPVSYEPPD